MYFRLIFRCFECEGFVFQAFTRAVNACEGFKEKPLHWKNRRKSGAIRYKRLLWCECLKNQAFTLETSENQQETRSV